jgi:hypothetical protein
VVITAAFLGELELFGEQAATVNEFTREPWSGTCRSRC